MTAAAPVSVHTPGEKTPMKLKTPYPRLRQTALALLIPGALALAGCNSSDGTTTGTATFSVTDAPADDVTAVEVKFDRVDLMPQGGQMQTFVLDEPRRIDLFALQGENAAVLIEDIELPAGQYNFIRLYVIGGSPDSQVTEAEGGVFPLYIPGSQPPTQNTDQRFLQLSRPFVVPAGGHADFTIDVELRKALVKTGNDITDDYYLLRPSLRLVDNSTVGAIAGIIDSALVEDLSCSGDLASETGYAVYVYSGFDAIPGDIFVDEDGQEQTRSDGAAHPLTLANVRFDADSSAWKYTVGFVSAGEYTVAFTCQAIDDAPGSEDDIAFPAQRNVTVSAGVTANADLPADD
jgi:hypothetical protein